MATNMFSQTSHLPARTLAYVILSSLLLLCSALPFPLRAAAQVRCKPTDSKDVLLFFLGNYIAHAATIPARAGGKWMESLLFTLFALAYPFFGITRAITLFSKHIKFRKDEIGSAIAQGAVMVAVRSQDWEPPSIHYQLVFVGLLEEFLTDTTSHVDEHPKARLQVIPFRPRADVQDSTHTFHGQTILPTGYNWSILDSDYLDSILSHNPRRSEICVGRSRSWVKMFTSIVQLVLLCITLYRTRGPQIDQYGYAAFGLSVFPYALMSFINFILVGVTGEYVCLFALRTAISDEAKGRGGRISGEFWTPLDVSGQEMDVILPEVRGADGTNRSNDEMGTSVATSEEGGLLQDSNKEPGEVDKKLPARSRLESLGRGWITGMRGAPFRTYTDDMWQFASGQKEFTPMWLRTKETEHGKILVVRTNSMMKRFKLVDWDDDSEDVLTFYVDSVTNQPKSKHNAVRWEPWLFFLGLCVWVLVVLVLPYVFLFCLTRFHKQGSTRDQRGWMMAWLVTNQLSSLGIIQHESQISTFGEAEDVFEMIGIACSHLYYLPILIPAICGFLMVRNMLFEFGSCSLVP